MTISDISLEALSSWENLWLAYRKAAKGKRGLSPAATFDYQIADKLISLGRELLQERYRPSRYRSFTIHEPKRRKISAAPFRDRVVHHALCNLIEPIFESRFIADSYANRMGKGTHRAIDRLQSFSRHYRYVLRCDIKQHFPSLDHAILRTEITKTINSPAILALIDHILQGGEGILKAEYDMVYFPNDDLFAISRPRGLPIGNLTSQFWSNVYMNPLDHFVRRQLRCPAYLRYVDDFALFSDSKQELQQWKHSTMQFLAKLRLTIHETEAQVIPCTVGIPWLGFVVYPDHKLLKRRNAVHFTQRLETNISLYQQHKITFAEFDASVQGWINHVRFADTWGLRTHIFENHTFRAPKDQKF